MPTTPVVKYRNLTTLSTLFQLLWIGQVVSWIGNDIHRVGMAWFVNAHFGGVYSEVGLGVAMALPMALAAVFAGVIVDRFNKSKILLMTDLVRAVISGGSAFLFWLYAPNLWVIYIITALIGFAGLLFSPAVQTMLPEIAQGDRDSLIRMNTLYMSSATIIRVVGPAVAGFMLPFLDIKWILWVDSATFLFSALMIQKMMKDMRKLGIESNQTLPKKKNIWKEANAGISFIFKNPVLAPQFIVFPLLEGITMGVAYLLPVMLAAQKQDGKLFGVLLGVYALGRFLGITTVKKFGLINRRGIVFTTNLILQGAALAVLGATSTPWIMIVSFLVQGIPSGAASISISTYVQDSIEAEFRGRIFSAIQSLSTILVPVSIVGLGAVAAVIGVDHVFLLCSLVLVLGGLFLTTRKAVREAR